MGPPTGKNVAVCLACNAAAEKHDHTVTIAGVQFSLCRDCWAKVERPGRWPAQTIDAIIMASAPGSTGQRELSEADRVDLIRLGLRMPGETG